MKKILRYKSFISFCLVFLLAFGVVTDYKQKETQAFVLVDDLLFWVLGGLVLATGVVALSPLQQKDMGFNVFNKFKSFGYSEEDLFVDVLHGTGKAIKFGTGLKSAIDFVSKNLSNTKIKSDMPISVTADKVPSIFTTIDNSNKDKRYIYNISGIKDNSFKFVFAFPGAYESFTNVVSIPNGVNYVQLQFGYANPSNTFLSWQMIFDGVERGWNSISAGGNTLVLKNYTGSITGQFQIEVDYTSPKIKANYSETALNTSIPYDDSKPAYVPIPSREVIDTKTYDKPVTYDDVKDIVETIPLDTPVDTPVDTPSGILEGIKSFFSGLWDMLKGLLNGILGAIGALGDLIKSLIGGLLSGLSSLLSSILDVIKSILSAIGNIVSGILNGLLDLLLSLFVPYDTYFTDKFNGIKANLNSILNIDSYTKLFNSDYADSSIKDITVTVFGQTVTIVKFSMYEHFRNVINTLIYAFMFFLLAIYNYSQVYKLIRGSDYVSASSTITHMGGGLTNSDMRKIISHEKPIIKLGDGKK